MEKVSILKEPPEKGALVILSGGLDSCCCLSLACNEVKGLVHAITFDYGQRNSSEIIAADRLCEKAKNKYDFGIHIIADLDIFGQLEWDIQNVSLLLSDVGKLRKTGYKHDSDLPSYFVPARNFIFIGLAAVRAYHLRIGTIYIGSAKEGSCPDNFPSTLRSIQEAISLSLGYRITIVAPFIYSEKRDIIRSIIKTGDYEWLADTHSCFENTDYPCLKCPPCEHREKGFAELGRIDPLLSRGDDPLLMKEKGF